MRQIHRKIISGIQNIRSTYESVIIPVDDTMKYFLSLTLIAMAASVIPGVSAEQNDLVLDSTIMWDVGKIQLLEDAYSSTGTAVVRVIDPDMNLIHGEIDNFDVDVWSGTDLTGIDLTVTETDTSSGIFEGTVFFSTTDNSSGHRLRISQGDTVFAKYVDTTIPKSDYNDISVLIDTAIIKKENPVSKIEDRVVLDRKSYGWGDDVIITVTAPELNIDSKVIEKISNDAEKSPIKINTRHFEIKGFSLVETDVDTGVFSGKVTLNENDLPSADSIDYHNDGITVNFEYQEDMVAIGSAPIVKTESEDFIVELPLSDQKTCEALLWVWISPNTCQIPKKFGSGENGTITIYDDVILEIPASINFTNRGTINNYGEIQNNGVFDNQEGTLNNKNMISNNGVIKNNGGTIDNNGVIGNSDRIDVGLYGTLDNNGVILGSGIITGYNLDSARNTIPPYQQIRYGILPMKVECKESLQLIMRNNDSSACVSFQTKIKLVEREWNQNVDKFESVGVKLDQLKLRQFQQDFVPPFSNDEVMSWDKNSEYVVTGNIHNYEDIEKEFYIEFEMTNENRNGYRTSQIVTLLPNESKLVHEVVGKIDPGRNLVEIYVYEKKSSRDYDMPLLKVWTLS